MILPTGQNSRTREDNSVATALMDDNTTERASFTRPAFCTHQVSVVKLRRGTAAIRGGRTWTAQRSLGCNVEFVTVRPRHPADRGERSEPTVNRPQDKHVGSTS
eukprot:CAMPEP_0194540830 /NCGR_PEP_ID=MMETSP0253-20130528/81231_1 /TAXON_ID=2966 /ORGANISM="Noctiluca scintillans" /LENGTH=103 /DNA_ID=CAMNT_0039387245 /DNA_START=255 /DNA_END=566 /DNA_ORIENTATION=-